MFQFPTFALGNGFLSRSVSRFGDPRLRCLRTANRGFSQLITSFVASQRQGIHRLLFVACSPYLHPNVARTCSGGPDCANVRSSSRALRFLAEAWGAWRPCGGGRRGANHWVVATRATALVFRLGPLAFQLRALRLWDEHVHSFFIARQVFKEPLRACPRPRRPGLRILPWGFALLAPLGWPCSLGVRA